MIFNCLSVLMCLYIFCLSTRSCGFCFFFFFSSRRRHTRYIGDWSSDVCSSDLGFPFIIEVGIASGKQIETQGKILLFRFANKIPLLFDEASDVSWKVVDQIDWRGYRVIPGETPLAVFVHVCSTKIPYKTVGKEFIADRPEVEHEILNAIREASRNLRIYLSRREHLAQEKKRVDVFEKYLPKVAQFSTKLSKAKKEPDIKPLLKGLIKYGAEENEEGKEGSE